jgi:hypothetical protein
LDHPVSSAYTAKVLEGQVEADAAQRNSSIASTFFSTRSQRVERRADQARSSACSAGAGKAR